MIPYIIYTALILTGCLIFYKLLLQKETFFKLNRLVLVLCLLFAFVLPLIKVPQQWSFRKAETPAVIYPQILTDDYTVPTVQKETASPVVDSASVQKASFSFDDVKKWAILLYWFGVMAFGLNFLIQLAVLIYQAYSKPIIRDGRYRIVEITGDKAPCSFGNNIFINPEKYDWDTYNQILLHEKIHVQQRHTIDLVLAELMLIFQWFNPFAWIYRKAVENNLEFLTDSRLLENKKVEKTIYQMSLLKVSAPHFPLSLTTNYNQSLLKKRIFMMNSKRSNVHTAWKYFFIIPMMVLFASIFNDTVVHAQTTTQKKEKNDRNINDGLATEGAWFATIKDDKINIQFKSNNEDHSFNSNTFKLSDFGTLPRDKQGSFKLTRDAGTIEFTGKFEGDKGMGDYKFTANKDYAAFLKKEGIDETTDKDLMAFFLVNVSRSYVQMLKQNGFTDLSKNDLLPLAALDINEAYIKSIKSAGFPDISKNNLIPFRALGVDAAYINEIRKAGYSNLSADKVISFKAQGIDAKYIADIKNSIKFDADVKEPSTNDKNDENINEKVKEKIKDKEQRGDKGKDMRYRGERQRDNDDNIVAFKALNIDQDYINSIKAVGFTNVTGDELIGMKANGVTPEYIKSIQSSGFSDVTPNGIISAKANGINATVISDYKTLGFDDLSLNNIIGAKATGTTPSFVKSMREKGYNLKSINKYITLKVSLSD